MYITISVIIFMDIYISHLKGIFSFYFSFLNLNKIIKIIELVIVVVIQKIFFFILFLILNSTYMYCVTHVVVKVKY